MRFRPCIDIHNGSVKQIVGGSLSDKDNHAKDNFVSLNDAGFYAQMYKNDGLKGKKSGGKEKRKAYGRACKL